MLVIAAASPLRYLILLTSTESLPVLFTLDKPVYQVTGVFPYIVRCTQLEGFYGMIPSTMDGKCAGCLRCPTRRRRPGRDEKECCHDRARAAGDHSLRAV